MILTFLYLKRSSYNESVVVVNKNHENDILVITTTPPPSPCPEVYFCWIYIISVCFIIKKILGLSFSGFLVRNKGVQINLPKMRKSANNIHLQKWQGVSLYLKIPPAARPTRFSFTVKILLCIGMVFLHGDFNNF